MTDVNEILQELKIIKQDIEEAKQEKAKYEGVLSEHYKALKALGIKSVAEGQKHIKKLKSEIIELEEDIQKSYSSLKGSYEW